MTVFLDVKPLALQGTPGPEQRSAFSNQLYLGLETLVNPEGTMLPVEVYPFTGKGGFERSVQNKIFGRSGLQRSSIG